MMISNPLELCFVAVVGGGHTNDAQGILLLAVHSGILFAWGMQRLEARLHAKQTPYSLCYSSGPPNYVLNTIFLLQLLKKKKNDAPTVWLCTMATTAQTPQAARATGSRVIRVTVAVATV